MLRSWEFFSLNMGSPVKKFWGRKFWSLLSALLRRLLKKALSNWTESQCLCKIHVQMKSEQTDSAECILLWATGNWVWEPAVSLVPRGELGELRNTSLGVSAKRSGKRIGGLITSGFFFSMTCSRSSIWTKWTLPPCIVCTVLQPLSTLYWSRPELPKKLLTGFIILAWFHGRNRLSCWS